MTKMCGKCNYATKDAFDQISKKSVKTIEGFWCYKNMIFVAEQRAEESAVKCKFFADKE
jgi:hypothetical protein